MLQTHEQSVNKLFPRLSNNEKNRGNIGRQNTAAANEEEKKESFCKKVRTDSREARSDDGTETGGLRIDVNSNKASKIERDAMDTIGITAIDRRAIQRLEAASFGSHFSSGS